MKGALLAVISVLQVSLLQVSLLRVSLLRILALGILALQLPIGVARAQDGRSPGACFDFVSPQQGVTPGSVLKVNRCTGESWMLTRTRLSEAKPGSPGSYAYRWVPLTHDEKEAVFPAGQ
jgi:hypothetical protein